MKAPGTKVLALFLLFFACALSFSARVSYADIPKTIQYEGKLVSKGNLASDGTYSMTFSIYDSSTGGTALWTETLQVQVTTGVFSALLGNTTPVNLSFDKQYYMGLSVNGEAEMTPRQTLSSAGYSFNADTVDTFHASSTAAANTILPLDANAKLPASVIDTTSATNMVTQIVAGSNVTISPAAGTGAVTISATGGSGGAGTVTSVATGTGLTGGPVTGSGTISIASGGVSTTEILDGTIANADISDTAAIAKSKLAALGIVNADVDAAAALATSKISGAVTSITGHGLGGLATLSAVGSSEITNSSISFSDMGANGCAVNQIMKYDGAAWVCAADATSGGIGVGSISSTEILDGTIANADISATAAIASSKIAGGPFIATTPSSAQTIQPSADVVPLIIKDDAVGTTANLLDVQNNAGTSLVKVSGSGNLLVGSSPVSFARVAVKETGTQVAGYFEISNPASMGSALEAATNSTDNAIYGHTTGTGRAGYFQINNAGNSASVIDGNTTGTGNLLQLRKSGADKFVVDNAGNITVGSIAGTVKTTPSSAQTILPSADVVPLIIKDDAVGTTANLLDVQNNAGTSLVKVSGSGKLLVGSPTTTTPKVSVYETGTNNAGYFEINNAGSVSEAVYSRTNGTGNAGRFVIFNAASGGTALFSQTNGTGNAVYGYTTGTGKAGFFQVDNAANGSEAVTGVTNGTGRAAWFQIANAVNGSDALTGVTNGTGRAGFFWINNAGNASSALYVETNGTGRFIDASNGAFLSNGGVWTNASSRELKKDIAPFTQEEYEQALEKIMNTDVVHFRYKNGVQEKHVGLIAEDAPEEMASENKKGLYTADSIAMLLAAIKAQQKQIEAQAAEMEILKQKISVLEGKP